MRARSWIALGGLMLACGGTAFNSTDNGSGGGGNGAGGSQASGGASGGKSSSGGTLGHSGSSLGGSTAGNGGKQGKAGSVGVAGIAGDVTRGGDVSVGGDVTVGGSLSMGGDSASAGAGGPDPIDKSCPADLPASGKGCANGLTCSYGDDIRPSCHSRATCDNGAWSLELPKCPAITACPPIVQGHACDAQSASCTIQDSIFCTCTGCDGSGVCSTNTVWACASVSGPQACPGLVPNEGQACTGNSACSYGSCTTGEKLTATCNGTTWAWKPFSCPQ